MAAVVNEEPSDVDADPQRRWLRADVVCPLLLSSLFFGLSLRNVDCGSPIATDAARHAMNGALLHDLAWSGTWLAPRKFAEDFYARLPATSLPFHPPLFPMFEAGAFSLFGVNLFAARLLIALFTFGSVWLFCRMVWRTHGPAIAVTSSLTFFLLPATQQQSNDVMLEMPTMFFVIAAASVLSRATDRYTLRRALAFALLSACALWTKQNAVFLGLLPFALVVCNRSWGWLKRPAIWVSSCLFGAACLAMVKYNGLGMSHGLVGHFAGFDGFSGEWGLTGVVARNSQHYALLGFRELTPLFAACVAVATAGLAVAVAMRPRPRTAIYLCWAVCASAIPVFTFGEDVRYLLFAFPAYIVIGYEGLQQLGRLAAGTRWQWALPVLICGIVCLPRLGHPASYLTGPAEVAATFEQLQAKRILYCGYTDGPFIFAVRCSDAHQRRPVVIRGDKLPPEDFGMPRFSALIQDKQFDFVVLERGPESAPWDALVTEDPDCLAKLRRFDMKCFPHRRQNGELHLYEVRSPSVDTSRP